MAGANKARGNGRSNFSLVALGSITVIVVMMYMMLPTLILLLLSMAPTLISLIMNATAAKASFRYKIFSIGGLNFAGASPFLFRLWFTDNSWNGAIELFIGNGHFFIIYATAFVGWLFYYCIPPIVLSVFEMTDQRRVANLRESQARLVAKWGEEVASDVSVKNDKVPSAEKSESD